MSNEWHLWYCELARKRYLVTVAHEVGRIVHKTGKFVVSPRFKKHNEESPLLAPLTLKWQVPADIDKKWRQEKLEGRMGITGLPLESDVVFAEVSEEDWKQLDLLNKTPLSLMQSKMVPTHAHLAFHQHHDAEGERRSQECIGRVSIDLFRLSEDLMSAHDLGFVGASGSIVTSTDEGAAGEALGMYVRRPKYRKVRTIGQKQAQKQAKKLPKVQTERQKQKENHRQSPLDTKVRNVQTTESQAASISHQVRAFRCGTN